MAGKKGRRQGSSYKAQYTAYKAENRYEKNKIAKLEKTIKQQPNNEVLKAVLAKIKKEGIAYKRNRRALVPGSFSHKMAKVEHTIEQQKAYEKKLPKTKSPIVEALLPLAKAMKPKITIKRKRSAKPKRISANG